MAHHAHTESVYLKEAFMKKALKKLQLLADYAELQWLTHLTAL